MVVTATVAAVPFTAAAAASLDVAARGIETITIWGSNANFILFIVLATI